MSNPNKNSKIVILILTLFLALILICGFFLLGILLTLKFVSGGENPFGNLNPFHHPTTEETTAEPTESLPEGTTVRPTEEPGTNETESKNETNDSGEAKPAEKALSGLTLVASDGSVLSFEGNDFSWIADPENPDENYYTGSYKLYEGQDAENVLLSDYKTFDITDSELNSTFETWSKEDLRVLVLSTTEAKVDGKKLGEFDTVYYSFFDETKDSRFVLINMNEALVVTFEKQ